MTVQAALIKENILEYKIKIKKKKRERKRIKQRKDWKKLCISGIIGAEGLVTRPYQSKRLSVLCGRKISCQKYY